MSQKLQTGLGIDAGGTYTDAVIFDFRTQSVLAKAKALTTNYDYTVGIANALDQLPAQLLKKVSLTSISTTLATNAIVENQGRKTGLLVMGPYGLYEPDDIPHQPTDAIPGKLDIDGKELEPTDPAKTLQIAREMIARHQIAALAVSGFASTVNPQHELNIKKLLRENTNLSITCGHELSEQLNFKTRAITAVLNARIISRLENLIAHTKTVLAKYNIQTPITVVKGDGTLMSADYASQRPVETILSGPAASVAGAMKITDSQNAFVFDMGGTTTDTAQIQNGKVEINPAGANVGQHQTHVRALQMRTAGLGGDSIIRIKHDRITVGPRRVTPISCLQSQHPKIDQALNYIQRNIDRFTTTTEPLEILALSAHKEQFQPDKHEQQILELLSKRPHSLDEIARKTDIEYWPLIKLSRLVEHSLILRCSLTPTDLLHLNGRLSLWPESAAQTLCGIFAQIAQISPQSLIENCINQITRSLALEIIKKSLENQTSPDNLESCPTCKTILDSILDPKQQGYKIHFTLNSPIIGIGAPVGIFLPPAAKLLNAQSIIPPDADVANAIGAIASQISITRHVQIVPDISHGFVIEGIPSAPKFEKLDHAHEFALENLTKIITEQGQKAGAQNPQLQIDHHDEIQKAATGQTVFLYRTITANITARPES